MKRYYSAEMVWNSSILTRLPLLLGLCCVCGIVTAQERPISMVVAMGGKAKPMYKRLLELTDASQSAAKAKTLGLITVKVDEQLTVGVEPEVIDGPKRSLDTLNAILKLSANRELRYRDLPPMMQKSLLSVLSSMGGGPKDVGALASMRVSISADAAGIYEYQGKKAEAAVPVPIKDLKARLGSDALEVGGSSGDGSLRQALVDEVPDSITVITPNIGSVPTNQFAKIWQAIAEEGARREAEFAKRIDDAFGKLEPNLPEQLRSLGDDRSLAHHADLVEYIQGGGAAMGFSGDETSRFVANAELAAVSRQICLDCRVVRGGQTFILSTVLLRSVSGR